MNPIRHIRCVAVLTGLTATLVALATAPAFATTEPAPDGGGPAVAPRHLAPIHTVVSGGMPGWLITLIAVGAAVLAATIAVRIDHRGQGTSVWSAPDAHAIPPARGGDPAAPVAAGTARPPAHLVTGGRRG